MALRYAYFYRNYVTKISPIRWEPDSSPSDRKASAEHPYFRRKYILLIFFLFFCFFFIFLFR